MIRSSTRDARAARGATDQPLSSVRVLTKIDSVTTGLPLRAIFIVPRASVGRAARRLARDGVCGGTARARARALRAFPDASHRSSGSSARGRGWAGVARARRRRLRHRRDDSSRPRPRGVAWRDAPAWDGRIGRFRRRSLLAIVASFATRAATEPASSPPKLKGITTRPNGRVSVRVSGGGVKQKTVGTFDTLEEALAAYNVEAVKRGVPTQTLPARGVRPRADALARPRRLRPRVRHRRRHRNVVIGCLLGARLRRHPLRAPCGRGGSGAPRAR